MKGSWGATADLGVLQHLRGALRGRRERDHGAGCRGLIVASVRRARHAHHGVSGRVAPRAGFGFRAPGGGSAPAEGREACARQRRPRAEGMMCLCVVPVTANGRSSERKGDAPLLPGPSKCRRKRHPTVKSASIHKIAGRLADA